MGQHKNIDDEYFDDRIQCFVRNVSYDFNRRRGVVNLGEYSCTDMGGCIAMFTNIDKRVQIIETRTTEGFRDTCYKLTSDGWVAFRGCDFDDSSLPGSGE